MAFVFAVGECSVDQPKMNYTWPVKQVATIPGDIVIGGLHMVHEREDLLTCGPIMPQGGVQVWNTCGNDSTR